jgi:hypothetical protein
MGGEPYEEPRALRLPRESTPINEWFHVEEPLPPACAWCAGTFGQVTREMELGQPSPPQYLCPEHQAKWDDIVAVRVPLMRKELFHIPAGQGAMRGIPRTLSVSGTAAVALGLTEDPLFKVARDEVEREKQQDDLDRQRWEILRDAARAAIGEEGQARRAMLEGPELPIAAAIREQARRDSNAASRMIEGEWVESDAEVSEIPGPTPGSGDVA